MRPTEEEYREALEIWKENNSDKEYRDIPFNTIVKVNRKRVNIGQRVYMIEETNFSEIDERYESPTDAFVQQLDIASKEIFKEMQKDIFLLSNAITSRRVSQTTENEQVEWIKELYIDLINKINMGYGEEQFILEIANMCVCLKNEFLLNESEIQFIKDKAINYYKMMRQFQSSNVELEIDVNKQLIRKKDYGLENDKKF